MRKATRLLIVDDHQDTLDLFAVLLGQCYDVVTCCSGAQGLASLDRASPDVVILDIGMAPMDGVECLAAIRAVPRYACVPAIALTGWARETDRQRFLQAGFQAVVAKPVLDEPLIIAVESLLTRRPAQSLTPDPGDGIISPHELGTRASHGAA
jgi:CheY-like chemotaxis protein